MKSTVFYAVTVLAVAVTPGLADWVYEGQWGAVGIGNGQFNLPGDVAIATNGNVYVADAYNYRVQYFTATGSFLGKWGSRGSGAGQFEVPRGLAFASSGNVYVTDSANNDVPGADVCLWESKFYLTTTTGGGGKCTFKGLWIGFDDGKLTATKHNYKPYCLDNVTIGE
jgi:DNA-binding beta-propeller fold protein YncE